MDPEPCSPASLRQPCARSRLLFQCCLANQISYADAPTAGGVPSRTVLLHDVPTDSLIHRHFPIRVGSTAFATSLLNKVHVRGVGSGSHDTPSESSVIICRDTAVTFNDTAVAPTGTMVCVPAPIVALPSDFNCLGSPGLLV